MNRKTRRAAEARQQQEDERREKHFAGTPVGAAMIALHESLTAPEKEDWIVLVDGDDLYLTCIREQAGNTETMYVQTTVCDLRAGGTEGTIETANLSGLGCVSFVLPIDAEERGGAGCAGVAAGHRAPEGLQHSDNAGNGTDISGREGMGRIETAPRRIGRGGMTDDRARPDRRATPPGRTKP